MSPKICNPAYQTKKSFNQPENPETNDDEGDAEQPRNKLKGFSNNGQELQGNIPS
jgi:hypothetical protein